MLLGAFAAFYVALTTGNLGLAVLVALLAPLALNGDNGARLALLTTAAVMLLLKKPLPAIAAGVIAAAVFRHL